MKIFSIVFSALTIFGCGENISTPQVEKRSENEDYLSDLQETVKTHRLKSIGKAQDYDPALIELGRALFFDPVLSANKDITCSDCHDPKSGTSNALSLAVGTKGTFVDGHIKLGERKSFTPRNVPDLYNRDQPEIKTMFWDARLERIEDGQIVLYDKYEEKRSDAFLRIFDTRLDSILAAQAMLPVLNRDELRGHVGDYDVDGKLNLIAKVSDIDFESSWILIFEQVWEVRAYQDLLRKAFPENDDDSFEFVHLANALGAFIATTFSFDDSPWDRFLRGDVDALSDEERFGATLFFQKAKCGECHSGTLLSDQLPHNIGVRPISAGPDPQRGIDYGAQHRSHFGSEGRYAFRTPSLRNVALTAPYMHNGMYRTLEEVIDHKNDTWRSFWRYDESRLSSTFAPLLHTNTARIEPVTESLARQMQEPLSLTTTEKEALVSFLKALTSPKAKTLELEIPKTTVSKLKIR